MQQHALATASTGRGDQDEVECAGASVSKSVTDVFVCPCTPEEGGPRQNPALDGVSNAI
jgi:hypothetical protein